MTTLTKTRDPEVHHPLENEDDLNPAHEAEEDPDQQPMTLQQFMDRYQKSINRRITETYRPEYQPQDDDLSLPKLYRRPLGKQELTIRGVAHSLRKNMGTAVVGEMGTGKTYIAIVAARMAGLRTVLVMCPSHLVQKWKREVEATLSPNEGRATIVQSITDLKRLQRHQRPEQRPDGHTLYVIISKEKAKLSHTWTPQVLWRLPLANGKLSVDENGRYITSDPDDEVTTRDGNLDVPKALQALQRVPHCPACGQRVVDAEGTPLTQSEVLRSPKKLRCLNHLPSKGRRPRTRRKVCGNQLWQAQKHENMRNNRISLTLYARKKMGRFFDLFIADEVHEYKAKRTAQGLAAADGAHMAGRSLILTGTLMGGYSSTLFYLLYRFKPEFRNLFRFDGTNQWISTYGFYEHTVKFDNGPDTVTAHGNSSRRSNSRRVPPKEKPGLMPAALFHLIDNCAFLRLHDVSSKLPTYDEHVITIPMDKQVQEQTGYSQESAYRHLYAKMRAAMMDALAEGSARLMASYLQTMLAYPDAVTKGETAVDPATGKVLADIPPLSAAMLYPKEQELIDLVKQEKAAGRRVLVYVSHTNTRDITGRVKEVLQRAGIEAIVLKAETATATQRESWIQRQVNLGTDVLICNPKLVQTGLDLVQFPTILWYETEYSVYTMRQAARRSWRIGQTAPVNVYFMTYQNCLQADALKLVAQKVQTSLAVEGELPEDGLSAYADGGDNLFLTLARQIAGQLPYEAATPEELSNAFRRARERDKDDQLDLVEPDEWAIIQPAPQPTTAPAANGHKPAQPKAAGDDVPDPLTVKSNGQIMLFSLDAFLGR